MLYFDLFLFFASAFSAVFFQWTLAMRLFQLVIGDAPLTLLPVAEDLLLSAVVVGQGVA
jgi:hypothetical protein